MHAYVVMNGDETATLFPATPGRVARVRRLYVPDGSAVKLMSGAVEILPALGTGGFGSLGGDLTFAADADTPQTPVGGALQVRNLNADAASECWVAWDVV